MLGARSSPSAARRGDAIFLGLTNFRAARSMRTGTLPAKRNSMASISVASIKETLRQELRDAGWHSRGYLPHFNGGEIVQSGTFPLADSLAQTVLRRWGR